MGIPRDFYANLLVGRQSACHLSFVVWAVVFVFVQQASYVLSIWLLSERCLLFHRLELST